MLSALWEPHLQALRTTINRSEWSFELSMSRCGREEELIDSNMSCSAARDSRRTAIVVVDDHAIEKRSFSLH